MAWYDEAVFYHIYPLGMTGAPKQNSYSEPVHRLNTNIHNLGENSSGLYSVMTAHEMVTMPSSFFS